MSHYIASYLLYSEDENSDFITDITPFTENAPYIYDSLGEKAQSANCGCSGCGVEIEFTRAEIKKAYQRSRAVKRGANREIIEFFLITLQTMRDAKANIVMIRFN